MILHELISFDILRVIWWVLLGVLLIGFALTDGFDLGVGAVLPFVARTDPERRQTIDTVAPVWEGNQVWFILGGGAIFAAWPPLYAVSFSGFYMAMFLILSALILRPVAFKYRSKRPEQRWRTRWDWVLSYSGALPALVFGVAVGNVLLGVPFHLTEDLHSIYDQTGLMKLLGLFRPFAVLCGVVSLALLISHGCAWLVLKATGPVQDRARRFGIIAAAVALAGYALAGVWLAFGVRGFHLAQPPVPNGASNPLLSQVIHDQSWLLAYAERPWIAIAPAMAVIGLLMVMRAMRRPSDLSPLMWSKMAIFGMISSVGLTMFPFILPSNTAPDSSLTVWDASSSHLTLFIMLVASIIFMPIILAYTAWVYRVLWGKVEPTAEDGHGY